MRSNRLLIGTASAFAFSLVLSACGGTGTGTAASSSPTTSAALIHTTSMKVGSKTETVLKSHKGLTLYYFTPDTAASIACTGACASLWPPLTSSSATPTSDPSLPGALTVVNGANGNQVAYNGHPLYTYSKDGDAGDVYGEGIGGKWFAATPDLAAATAASAATSKSPPSY